MSSPVVTNSALRSSTGPPRRSRSWHAAQFSEIIVLAMRWAGVGFGQEGRSLSAAPIAWDCAGLSDRLTGFPERHPPSLLIWARGLNSSGFVPGTPSWQVAQFFD